MSFWDSLTGAAEANPLGAGILGLGLASDVFGAYSQQQAAQRQRDQMNRQYALAQLVTNPQYMAGQAQKLVQGYSPAEQQYYNQIFNANLAGRGLQEGQAGNQIVAQAWAPLVQQQYQDALNKVYGAYGAASGMVGVAPIGGPAGGGGGTMGALQNLALLQALRGQPPQNLSPGQTTFNPQVYGNAQYMGDPSQYQIGSGVGSYGGYSGLPNLTTGG